MTAAYDKIKSTIDGHCLGAVTDIQLGMQLGGYLTMPFETADVDDVINFDEKAKGDKPLIGWGIEYVNDAPRAPLFAVLFRVVFRLPNDASNSAQAKAISMLQGYFRTGLTLDITDGIDPGAAGQKFGRLYMVTATVAPAAADGNASVRELRVEARASCR